MLRKYQEEIERLKDLLESRQSTPFLIETVGSPRDDVEINITSNQSNLDLKRDKLIREYEAEMQKLKNLHESEKSEKEGIVKQIEIIKEEYRRNIEKLNEQMRQHKEEIKPSVSTHEILERIAILKASMIGGEKANDKELSERRRRKKLAAERRLR